MSPLSGGTFILATHSCQDDGTLYFYDNVNHMKSCYGESLCLTKCFQLKTWFYKKVWWGIEIFHRNIISWFILCTIIHLAWFSSMWSQHLKFSTQYCSTINMLLTDLTIPRVIYACQPNGSCKRKSNVWFNYFMQNNTLRYDIYIVYDINRYWGGFWR